MDPMGISRFEMPVLLVYVLDPRYFCTSPFGVPRTGPFRQRFLLDAWRVTSFFPKREGRVEVAV